MKGQLIASWFLTNCEILKSLPFLEVFQKYFQSKAHRGHECFEIAVLAEFSHIKIRRKIIIIRYLLFMIILVWLVGSISKFRDNYVFLCAFIKLVMIFFRSYCSGMRPVSAPMSKIGFSQSGSVPSDSPR